MANRVSRRAGASSRAKCPPVTVCYDPAMTNPAATSFRIETMRPEDWTAVRAVYLEGIATGNATFETEAPPWVNWDAAHAAEPRLVARDGVGAVLGWAALTPVSGRCVYAGVGDLSVYVSEAARGRGVGRALLQALVSESERAGIWTLQAGIFPENEASLALHKSCGFREVGRRERIGKMNGVWRDVILMERRSGTAGV
jgi:L-amino acid N-acyltransferase YncA